MVFSSFIFLSVFLPVILIFHSCIPNIKVKNVLLVIASFIFYAYGEPVYIFLLILSAAANYVFGLLLNGKRRKIVIITAVTVNILLLVIFKYTGFIITSINTVLPDSAYIPVPNIELPIGISFYTFQAVSYLIDIYRNETKPQRNLLYLALYISFFPQLIAGPILKYHDIDSQIESRSVTIDSIKRGICRFSCGLGKKILIANVMAYIADTIYGIGCSSVGALAAWTGAVSYFMQIYFDFSGYSDMAIGLGNMFGFQFPENFNYPYISGSIQEFWRRWHISLSSWFRDYLYIPLGGNRRGKIRTIINKYIVFLATGIWHGADWTFLIWGIYHGTFMAAEQTGLIPIKKCKSRIVAHTYTLLVVIIGFVIFRADTVRDAFFMIKAMFGFGNSDKISYGAAMSFFSPYYFIYFAVAIAGCTSFPNRLYRKLNISQCEKNSPLYELAGMAGSILILLFSFMKLAGQSYNPFIYFRF